jgi:hypothetical protein
MLDFEYNADNINRLIAVGTVVILGASCLVAMTSESVFTETRIEEVFTGKYYRYFYGEKPSLINFKFFYYPVTGESNYFKSLNNLATVYYRPQYYRLSSSKDFVIEWLNNYTHFLLNALRGFVGSNFDSYLIFSVGLVFIINCLCISSISKNKSRYENNRINSRKIDFILYKFLIAELFRKDFLVKELHVISKNIIKSDIEGIIEKELLKVESLIVKLKLEISERAKPLESRSQDYMLLRNQLRIARSLRSRIPTDELLMEKLLRNELYKIKLENDDQVTRIIDSEKIRFKAAKLEAAKLEAAKLEAAKLEAAKLEAAQLGAAQLGAAQLGAAQLGAAQLGAAQLGAAQLDAARLDKTQPVLDKT